MEFTIPRLSRSHCGLNYLNIVKLDHFTSYVKFEDMAKVACQFFTINQNLQLFDRSSLRKERQTMAHKLYYNFCWNLNALSFAT